MAEKRMFAKTIVESDAFLDMPLSAQALYFHYGMLADDEGFVNSPKRIQRSIGASEDDLKLLIAKRFIIAFETGIIVIKHWKVNNYIPKDRFKETTYKSEKALIIQKENGSYTECIQDVYKMDTQNRLDKIRLDKISIDNIDGQDDLDRVGQKNKNDLKEECWKEQFEEFYKKYPKKVKKQNVKNWFKKNKPSSDLFSSIMSSLEQFRGSADWLKDKGQYIPYPSTWLNQRRWEDEEIQKKISDNSSVKNDYQEIDFNNLTDEQYQNMVRGESNHV